MSTEPGFLNEKQQSFVAALDRLPCDPPLRRLWELGTCISSSE
ncbi:MAG: hypothetical protein OXC62_13445 [Aestuariivita sp.]|nr:hypothetical protein [Aestuariivita sp.]